MSFLAGPSRRWGERASSVLWALAVALPILAGAVFFVFYRPPAGVRDPSRVLEALGPENKVGDVWGLDIFLEKKGAELLTPDLQRPKAVMNWLFAAKIIGTSAWDRPLDDLKYAFFLMRQDGVRRMSGFSVFLMDLKESVSGSFRKSSELDEKEEKTLRGLQEEGVRLPSGEMEKKCRELLAGGGSDAFKARLAARAAFLREKTTGGEGARQDLDELSRLCRRTDTPFFLTLAEEALRESPPAREKDLSKKMKNAVSGEAGTVLAEYQNALELLSIRDYNGFVERVKKMVVAYPQKEFTPALLYQAWGVLKYDLHDAVRAEEALAGFKSSYPASEWSRPERSAGIWDAGKGRVVRGPAKQSGQPPSFLRNTFKASFVGIARNINRFTGMLKEDQIYEKDFDERTVNEWMGDFLPPSAKKILTGYKVAMVEDGLDIFAGVKFGGVNFNLLGRGALVAEAGPGGNVVRMKFREIRLQNVPVPRLFLDQFEKDFDSAWAAANTSLDVLAIQYWTGGMRVTLKKKPEPLAGAGAVEPAQGVEGSKKDA